MINIEETAKIITNNYFTKRYPSQPKIDLENIVIQVENFAWNGASYRIDVFFLHQKPSFLPYYQNFWMSHRIWMAKSGNAVKQEPVYTSNAIHPELKSNANENIVGLFPGNYYFKKEFDFIDHSLKNNKSPLILKSGPGEFFQYTFNFKNGISDLERMDAYVIQLLNGYRIVFEGEKYPTSPGLSMYDISFDISNEGKCTSITSKIREIPGLC